MAGEHALLEVEDLEMAYGALPVLRGIDFNLDRGEALALLGANGSGKSTLLRLLCGLSKATGGCVRVGGWEMPGEAMRARAQIGLVAHQPLLYDNLTASENLRFFGALYGMHAHARDRRVDEALRSVGMRKWAGSLTRTLSRGMKQRLSIARATLHQPSLLLLDEPYTGLDQGAVALLDGLLEGALAEGCAVVLCTHQLERLPPAIERVMVLSRGKISLDESRRQRDLRELYRAATA